MSRCNLPPFRHPALAPHSKVHTAHTRTGVPLTSSLRCASYLRSTTSHSSRTSPLSSRYGRSQRDYTWGSDTLECATSTPAAATATQRAIMLMGRRLRCGLGARSLLAFMWAGAAAGPSHRTLRAQTNCASLFAPTAAPPECMRRCAEHAQRGRLRTRPASASSQPSSHMSSQRRCDLGDECPFRNLLFPSPACLWTRRSCRLVRRRRSCHCCSQLCLRLRLRHLSPHLQQSREVAASLSLLRHSFLHHSLLRRSLLRHSRPRAMARR